MVGRQYANTALPGVPEHAHGIDAISSNAANKIFFIAVKLNKNKHSNRNDKLSVLFTHRACWQIIPYCRAIKKPALQAGLIVCTPFALWLSRAMLLTLNESVTTSYRECCYILLRTLSSLTESGTISYREPYNGVMNYRFGFTVLH